MWDKQIDGRFSGAFSIHFHAIKIPLKKNNLRRIQFYWRHCYCPSTQSWSIADVVSSTMSLAFSFLGVLSSWAFEFLSSLSISHFLYDSVVLLLVVAAYFNAFCSTFLSARFNWMHSFLWCAISALSSNSWSSWKFKQEVRQTSMQLTNKINNSTERRPGIHP